MDALSKEATALLVSNDANKLFPNSEATFGFSGSHFFGSCALAIKKLLKILMYFLIVVITLSEIPPLSLQKYVDVVFFKTEI